VSIGDSFIIICIIRFDNLQTLTVLLIIGNLGVIFKKIVMITIVFWRKKLFCN